MWIFCGMICGKIIPRYILWILIFMMWLRLINVRTIIVY